MILESVNRYREMDKGAKLEAWRASSIPADPQTHFVLIGPTNLTSTEYEFTGGLYGYAVARPHDKKTVYTCPYLPTVNNIRGDRQPLDLEDVTMLEKAVLAKLFDAILAGEEVAMDIYPFFDLSKAAALAYINAYRIKNHTNSALLLHMQQFADEYLNLRALHDTCDHSWQVFIAPTGNPRASGPRNDDKSAVIILNKSAFGNEVHDDQELLVAGSEFAEKYMGLTIAPVDYKAPFAEMKQAIDQPPLQLT